jgi:dTDP-glucose 4,6-dehydratase
MALVIHCAATIADDLDEARRVNVGGTAALAAAAREAGCRQLVHISTVSVYDWEAGLEIFDESAPLKSAVSALAAEMERGLAATILRLGAVLGVHPTSSWAVIVPGKIRTGEVKLTGDGITPLPWTHVANVRRAVELALAKPVSRGRAYNLVDGHVTWRRYVEDVRSWFADTSATQGPREPGPPEERAFVGRCAIDRIREDLGYQPLRTYEDGMAEAAAWWRDHPQRPQGQQQRAGCPDGGRR